MRKSFIAVLIFACNYGYTQQLSQVTFSQVSNFSWFSLLTNQNILIRVSAHGKISEYGTEEASVYNRDFFAPKLIPYSGVVSYYQHDPDSILNGKIKNIGTCYFTYYGSKDYPERAGKIRSAGNLNFDYYRNYEDPLNYGKIKNIGTNLISYYSEYENEAYKGKLKGIGNTAITYYSSFDNPSLKGKLKSIGSYRLDWTTTSGSNGFVYYLKTANQRPLIDGMTYVLQ